MRNCQGWKLPSEGTYRTSFPRCCMACCKQLFIFSLVPGNRMTFASKYGRKPSFFYFLVLFKAVTWCHLCLRCQWKGSCEQVVVGGPEDGTGLGD